MLLTPSQIKTETLSGLTVALALVPEAIAFAFVAHLHPLIGLYAAFIICTITAIFGGRPGMISGATGALAVVMVSLVVSHGAEYLFATVVMMGLIQILAGALKLGKFFKIIPHPVMLGFVNGLAIVIFMAQLGQFKTTQGSWITGTPLYTMLGLIALTMAIVHFLPKFTKAIPSALAAIAIIFAITELFGLDTKQVGDLAQIGGAFPSFHIPNVPFNLETLKIITPYAFTLAGVGLTESLLTVTLIDEITETHGRNSQECLAQGAANVVTGFFGGMGGCAMIGQSMINIGNGARHRLSGIAAGLFLIFFIVYASSLIERIPIAALTGIMFMVVIGTFAWSSIRLMNKIPLTDALIIVAVSLITVFYDLAIAVICGVIFSALTYAWESAKHITATIRINETKCEKTYHLYGPIFFGSIKSFKNLFTPRKDPKSVIVTFEHSRIWDHSAIEALLKLAEKYDSLEKTLKFKALSDECATILERSGKVKIIRNPDKDPHYELVMNHHHKAGSKDFT